MNREELNKELDEWLDRAAADYGKAEMRPGFEHRILAKIRSSREKKTWHFHWIPAMTAVAVLLCFSAYLLHIRFQNQRTVEVAVSRHAESSTAANAGFSSNHAGGLNSGFLNKPLQKPLKKRSAANHVSQNVREAKDRRFLSSGLSDQERCLIAFVREISKETTQEAPEKTLFEPLQFPEFQIESFEISSFKIDALPETIHGSEEEL